MLDGNEDALRNEAASDLRKLGNMLRKEALDPYNRLHSIELDASYVRSVAEEFAHLPIIANQRCGAWYVDPAQVVDARAYFKSTDGHTSQWAFSMRRANLHLLDLISERGGLIIVDATRRGKTFPDALSKTIPLWCAVINTAKGFEAGLSTPVDVVSASEHAQMAARIAPAAAELLESNPARGPLEHLNKPMKPVFVSRASSRPTLSYDPTRYVIVCLSASDNAAAHSRQHGFTYVPGAGDDDEGWAGGLTAALFWASRMQILSASRNDLACVMKQIIGVSSGAVPAEVDSIDLKPTRLSLDLGPLTSVRSHEEEATILLCSDKTHLESSSSVLVLKLAEGKKGHSALVNALPACLAFASAQIRRAATLRISYLGTERQDAATGLALALLVSLFDDQFKLTQGKEGKVTKAAIKQKLTWLTTVSAGRVNPSRAILTRLNGALIDDGRL